ncbi:hypothetical protein CERZMDRAFT_87774 [Cercospora zeae-maydis SCOH1-5]|uniref:Archaemetzincin-2 n=1 Tax=Cercospora zeae-maydis SCOH1-5 TaxID=717836 RepID=A0A6A6F4P4_9PEZI|nr:hypothetical protein CERZMDRAFT_87774 [Cercospora zeae-maydis SCOH1-5]
MPSCSHDVLTFDSSPHAQEAGFTRQSQHSRAYGAHGTTTNKTPPLPDVRPSTFPAPLVLPGDELSFDPKYEPQSLASWRRLKGRVAERGNRRTIYLVPYPEHAAEVQHAREWVTPQLQHAKRGVAQARPRSSGPCSPQATDLLEYLQAFYYPLQVKMYDGPRLEFVPWEEASGRKQQKKNVRERIGLNIGKEVIGIRHRPSKDGIYTEQLNLNDLLDAAIAMLPADAYALLMIVGHDLYEDEPDDFCCGRAYGGNRVAVVTSSRYNPSLDKAQEIETEHVWPASHCQAFVKACCSGEPIELPSKKPKSQSTRKSFPPDSAMDAAVATHVEKSKGAKTSTAYMNGLWFSRMCKTAAHELGHCVGMDHCVYFACLMQGTAGLSEDGAQPPYLCPVDLAKLLEATGGVTKMKERYEALLRFCEKWSKEAGGGMWAAFGAWIRVRLQYDEGRDVQQGSSVRPAIELSP